MMQITVPERDRFAMLRWYSKRLADGRPPDSYAIRQTIRRRFPAFTRAQVDAVEFQLQKAFRLSSAD